MNYWKFERTNFPKIVDFDLLLQRFYRSGIEGLVRENIQNSLDAKVRGIRGPVKVIIKTGIINKSYIPGYIEIINRINALQSANDYTKEAIIEMKSHLNETNVKYITFEDQNTKGLSGSHYNDLVKGDTVYKAYAYKKGEHVADHDQDSEASRGGSHGVGKISSNAASNFNIIFFANCDENGYKTLGGTIELIDHEIDNMSFRSTGYFTNSKDNVYYPYKNEQFHEIFHKNNRGLKIIIPFLRDQYTSEKEIIRAVCDNFLVSIFTNQLIVEVNDKLITNNNLEEYIYNNMYFEQEKKEIKKYFAPLYFETLNHLYTDKLYIENYYRAYRFKLYLIFDMEISIGRTGVFKTMGMKIEDHSVKSNAKKPYNAILIPYQSDGDLYLRSLENESHTLLDYNHINNKKMRESAKRFINNIDRKIAKIIEEKLSKDIPDSEILNTTDIIYEIENKFEKELKKRLSVINIGTKKNDIKTIVKVTNTDDPGNGKIKHKSKSKYNFKKVKNIKNKFGNDANKAYYSVPKSAIKRIVYRDYELIYIKLPKEIFGDYKDANLMISIIDGMGKEYSDEIDLNDLYSEILDKNNHKNINFSSTSIIGIDLSHNKINLMLYFKEDANKTLKYKYYLEV